MEKIESMNLLVKNLYQDAGNELRNLEKFKSSHESLTKLVKDNNLLVLASIKEVCAKIISRDILLSLRPPQAKAIY